MIALDIALLNLKSPNYGAIIVEKTHPDLELILARFDELAAFLKKPIG